MDINPILARKTAEALFEDAKARVIAIEQATEGEELALDDIRSAVNGLEAMADAALAAGKGESAITKGRIALEIVVVAQAGLDLL